MQDHNDDSFDKRVGGIVRAELGVFLKEQLPAYMEQIIKAVKKEVLEDIGSDTDQIAEIAAKKAMQKLNAQGEAFRDQLQAKAGAAAEQVATNNVQPSPEPAISRGQRVMDSVSSDPLTWFEHALGIWDRRQAAKSTGDPFTWWNSLTANRPDLAMYFAQSVVQDPLQSQLPIMLGKNTLDVYQMAFKQGLSARQDHNPPPFQERPLEESEAYRRGRYGTQPESSDLAGKPEPAEQPELTMASLIEG